MLCLDVLECLGNQFSLLVEYQHTTGMTTLVNAQVKIVEVGVSHVTHR